MKYVSLFAGIGGFDLALNRLGHECVYANEWDKYSAITYEKNFGHKPDTRDITTVRSDEIPDHDLLVGGFPCQAFSIAGKRRGFNETRGTLFFDVARILRDKRPRYFILENVKGLLNHDSGKTIQTIFGVLSDLGYDYQWEVLNSKNFGVPQNRERIFIVGHIRGKPRPKVFPIGEGNDMAFGEENSQTANTLTSNYWKGAAASRPMIMQINQPKHSNDRVYDPKGISPTLNTMQGGRRQPFVAMKWQRTEKGKKIRQENQKKGRDYTPFSDGARELTPSDRGVVGAITAQAIAKDSLIGNEMQIRKLTPLECERLQAFPDNWTEGVSDTQRYKQLGNAVTVNVVYEVAKLL